MPNYLDTKLVRAPSEEFFGHGRFKGFGFRASGFRDQWPGMAVSSNRM